MSQRLRVDIVRTEAQLQEFIDLPWELHPAHLHMPIMEETIRGWFHGRTGHPGRIDLVLIRDQEGAVRARSSVHTHDAFEQRLGTPTLFFGATEFADHACLETLTAWAAERGRSMGKQQLLGPVALDGQERCGVITSGFSQPTFMDQPWNPSRVPDSFEALARALTERADGDTSAVAVAAARISQALAAGDLEDAFTSILDPDSVWGAPGAVAQVVDVLRAAPDLAERDPSLATALEVAQHHPDDPGVVVAILLNRVDLAPGQAIHLPAGNVHAYLHGLGVEVMAASDNVLRGGLTPKHVDVPELRRVVTFEALPVPSTEPERVADSVVAFRPPFEEFELLQATLEDDAVHGLDVHGPGIAVVTRGRARLALAGQEIELGPGEAVFLPAAETASGPLAVRAAAGAPATVHVAGLPRG